jgi:hypothetical protein
VGMIGKPKREIHIPVPSEPAPLQLPDPHQEPVPREPVAPVPQRSVT